MFHHKERFLQYVVRWNIAPRMQDQSVAEHSYFVALYSDCLCRILQVEAARHNRIVAAALRHDMGEVLCSDIPGPVKRAVVDIDSLEDYERRFLDTLGPEYHTIGLENVHDKAIIKAADCIDATFYLASEVARGNQMLSRELDIAEDRMKIAIRALAVPFSYSRHGDLFEIISQEITELFGPIELAPRLDTDLPQEEAVQDEIPF